MSNNVNLQFTKFINIESEGKELDSSYGYRIYDDYGSDYNNLYDSLEELNESINENTIFSFIRKCHDDFIETIEYHNGIFLNNEWIVYNNKGDTNEKRNY